MTSAASAPSALVDVFRALHVPGSPLVLDNVWDAGSARVVAGAGAPAVATSSWAVAAAHGLEDGEQLALAEVLAVVGRVVAAVAVPVSVDLEAGYAPSAAGVGETVSRVVALGTAGANLEDGLAAGGVRTAADMAARLAAARAAADRSTSGWFLNARHDAFLTSPAATHPDRLGEAVERGRRYADAGADGYFVPGLLDPALVARLVREVPLPLNVMVTSPGTDLTPFAEAGAARVSRGPGPYLAAAEAVAGWVGTR